MEYSALPSEPDSGGFSTEDLSANSSLNTTPMAGPSDLPPLTAAMLIKGCLMAILIVLTIFGNILVIVAVATFHRLRSVTNYFVVSLAVADLTVAVLVMPYSLLYEVLGQWRFGWVFCYFWISCDVTCCTASILHLCVISLDRYLAITQPLTYTTRMSSRRALLMIAAVWLCSSAISFVPIYMGWFADSSVVTLYTDSAECGLYVNQFYAVISSGMSFYFPLIVMIVAYIKIFRIAQRQSREIRKLEQSIASTQLLAVQMAAPPPPPAVGGDQNNHHGGRHQPPAHPHEKVQRKSKRLQKESKAITTLGTLMGLFCICWLPFFLLYLILPFCPPCEPPMALVTIITWLGYTNSCINPCVYAFLNRDFRLAFRRILGCARRGGGYLPPRPCQPCYVWCGQGRCMGGQKDRHMPTVGPGAGRGHRHHDDPYGENSDSFPHESDCSGKLALRVFPSRRNSDANSVASNNRKYMVR